MTFTFADHPMSRFARLARTLAIGAALLAPTLAHAQNVVCPEPALGDNSNKCAPTSFVHDSIAQGLPLNQGYVFLGNSSNLAQGTPTPIFGVAGSLAGTLGLSGGTSGVVTIQTSPTTANYLFWLPIAAGTSGAPMLSGGGTGPHTYGSMSASWLNIDSNFAVVSNNLAFAPIPSGDLIANNTAGSAEPTASTLTAYLDRVIGASNGMFTARTGGAWGSATFGTGLAFSGSVLNLQAASASTIGGVNSITSAAHNWITFIDTAGLPHQAQPAFTDISGTLGFSQGGCNATSQVACTNNLLPTPTRAGDVIYWNGTTWVTLPGNNSGTQVLQENASGLPSWVTVTGTGTVTSVTCFGTAITSTGTCVTAAAKTDQQTPTSNALAVTPLHQQDHPSAVKAYVNFTGTGTNGAQTINGSYNVSGVSRTATGTYTVTFSPTPFANTTYSCHVNNNGGTAGPNLWGETGSKATGTVLVQFVTISGGTIVASDPTAGGDVTCSGTD